MGQGFEIVDEYNDGNKDICGFKCRNCGRIHYAESGADIACCPCEFEHEGEDDPSKRH